MWIACDPPQIEKCERMPQRFTPAADRVRTERDSLGERSIPDTALWGVRTARCVENLSFSGRTLGSLPVLLHALAAVKRACAEANAASGILAPNLASAIAAAAHAVESGAHDDQFPVDVLGGGGSIGLNTNLNEVIANLANEAIGGQRGAYDPIHPLRHVNASQSTADVCHTAGRVAILRLGQELDLAFAAVDAAYADRVHALGGHPTLARTCLRDALPTTVGVLLDGHRNGLARCRAALAHHMTALHEVTLGGTVIGDGSGAPPEYRAAVVQHLADVTGLPLTRSNRQTDQAQHSDDLARLSAELAQLAQAFLKIGRDLRLLSSGPHGGFGEWVLPRIQEGSSFFAGKSNPVLPETLLQCGHQILGADRAAQEATAAAELHLNVFDGQVVVNVIDAIAMASRAMVTFATHCIAGLEIDADRCRSLARQISLSQ